LGEFFEVAIGSKKKTLEEATKMLRDFILNYSITIACPRIDLITPLPIIADNEIYTDITLCGPRHRQLQIITRKGAEGKSFTSISGMPDDTDNNYTTYECERFRKVMLSSEKLRNYVTL